MQLFICLIEFSFIDFLHEFRQIITIIMTAKTIKNKYQKFPILFYSFSLFLLDTHTLVTAMLGEKETKLYQNNTFQKIMNQLLNIYFHLSLYLYNNLYPTQLPAFCNEISTKTILPLCKNHRNVNIYIAEVPHFGKK